MTTTRGSVPAFTPRPTTDRLVGCHVWASDLHRATNQLSAELKDLGQVAPAKRLAVAQQQLELACGDLDDELASRVNS